MSKLVSPKGEILIPGIKELIAPVTDEEREKFEAIHFGVKDIHAAVGGDQTLTNDKVTTLMGRMRNPSLSLHGIEGAFCKFLFLPSSRILGSGAGLFADIHSCNRIQDCHSVFGEGQILYSSRTQLDYQERH